MVKKKEEQNVMSEEEFHNDIKNVCDDRYVKKQTFWAILSYPIGLFIGAGMVRVSIFGLNTINFEWYTIPSTVMFILGVLITIFWIPVLKDL